MGSDVDVYIKKGSFKHNGNTVLRTCCNEIDESVFIRNGKPKSIINVFKDIVAQISSQRERTAKLSSITESDLTVFKK